MFGGDLQSATDQAEFVSKARTPTKQRRAPANEAAPIALLIGKDGPNRDVVLLPIPNKILDPAPSNLYGRGDNFREDLTIRQTAGVGWRASSKFDCKLVFDASRQDGIPRSFLM